MRNKILGGVGGWLAGTSMSNFDFDVPRALL